ncbi:hypothetical protein psal_cds_810 [Pandoravirus salinus]|uniref:Uncharacterized protein n=1 Tax=Pandoravirus salinus TaxID=1349410 RepID=S4W3I5_9VIRU|nr:hypothetical protein psal_cds_810 [Pandoravirus salinus]AGO84840.1 hypothetical protein psal_cds_810 [Pandoravirus salinus]
MQHTIIYVPMDVESRDGGVLPLPATTPRKRRHTYMCKTLQTGRWLFVCNVALLVVVIATSLRACNHRVRHDHRDAAETRSVESTSGVCDGTARPHSLTTITPYVERTEAVIETGTPTTSLPTYDQNSTTTAAAPPPLIESARPLQRALSLAQRDVVRSILVERITHFEAFVPVVGRAGRPRLDDNVKCITACLLAGGNCGWYSAEMAQVAGIVVYSQRSYNAFDSRPATDSDDKRRNVQVTMVGGPQWVADNVLWDDLQCIGPVGDFVDRLSGHHESLYRMPQGYTGIPISKFL